MRETAFLALGSNLGDRDAHLALARARIAAFPDTALTGASPIEETAPIGPVPQGAYLNQMLRVETALAPVTLLERCHAVEREAGRDRAAGVRWGPRTLDIDLVLFGDRVIETPGLRVPHPELPHRDFWQRGLAALGVAPWAPAEAAR